ncbi:MAG: DUF2339 domain-containing protein [Rhodobacterales bacterium]
MYFDSIVPIVILVGAYVLIMPLIAFIIAKSAAGKIKRLQAEVELLKIRAEGGIPVTVSAKPEVAAKTKQPGQKTKATQSPAAAPKTPTFFGRMVANFKANWIIWLAGASLSLGGLFIVQYGLQRGILGPTARVVSALGFGGILLVVAEYLRRASTIGMQGWFSLPVTFAAGSIATLYGAVVSAHVLYNLTAPLIGFASMIAVSFLAIGAGLIYGPVLAVVGILGAYISPMLVAGGESSPVLYLYFLAVLTAALAVERSQKWIWLSALAVAFSLFWGFVLNDALSAQPYLALYGAAIIWLATSIPAFGPWPKWPRHEMLDETTLGDIATHYPTVLSVVTAAATTALLSYTAADSLILWQAIVLVFLVLIAWAIFYCARAENLDQTSVIFAAGLLFAATYGSPYLKPGYEYGHFGFTGMLITAAACLFLIALYWRTARSSRPLFWVTCGAAAPVTAYFISYGVWHDVAPISDTTWTFLAVLLAAILATNARVMLRSQLPERLAASDLLFAGMLIATSFAAYMTLETEYLAHVSALLSLAALALVIRFKYRWTGYLILTFVAGATGLVVFDLFPDYSLSKPVFLVIAVFGVVAGLFAVGYRMAQAARLFARVVLYETAGFLTIALLVCALIARAASDGRWEFDYMVLGLYATVWTLMAGVQFRRMAKIPDRLVKLRRYLGYGYGGMGLFALAIGILRAPLFTSEITGTFPLDSVMAAYASPAIAAYLLYRFKLFPGFISRKIALWSVAIIGIFITIQQVRRFWHGPDIKIGRGALEGELYTYTVILLSATVFFVVMALRRKNPYLRKIGLALAAITAAKVFLWDTSGMQGLTRATIVIALGLTLAGIGWLLQVYATRGEDSKPAKSDT